MAGVHPIRPAPPGHGAGPAVASDPLTPLLPVAAVPLADGTGPTGERVDLGHVVRTLLTHRDRLRRQAA